MIINISSYDLLALRSAKIRYSELGDIDCWWNVNDGWII